MTAKEFFWLVASMRTAQRDYFKSRDKGVFLHARALENEVDREINRVKLILSENDNANELAQARE